MCVSVCVFVHLYGGAHDYVCVWRSEDNPFFHCIEALLRKKKDYIFQTHFYGPMTGSHACSVSRKSIYHSPVDLHNSCHTGSLQQQLGTD